MFTIALMSQSLPPNIHSAGFSDFYADTDKLPTVKGRVINLPDGLSREKLIGFAPVSILSKMQQEIDIDAEADGSFTLELPERYPAQEIWFWLNGGEDKLYYGTLLVRDGLRIEIDYAALLRQGGVNWDGGEGITFSGPDAELTRARNAITTQDISKGYNSAYIPVIMDRKSSVAEKRALLDSVYAEIEGFHEGLLEAYSPTTAAYFRNEDRSQYFGQLSVNYWNEELPDEAKKSYLEHAPLVMSNDSRDYYQYFAAGINAAARRAAKFPGDSTLTSEEKLQRQLAELNSVLAAYDAPRADLVYLYQSDKDPANDKLRLENALKNVSSPWVEGLLRKRYDLAVKETQRLEATLNELVPVLAPEDLGEALGTLPFGADLYRVTDEEMTGEALLAKIRGAFAGKALYLDHWAVWCQPCIGQMPHSSRLHGEARGLPVEFIYLCTDAGGSEETWKNLITQHQVGGIHLYVPDKVHSQLMELFSGSGYPTYVLLQADGTPNLDVKRPSELGRAELQALLKR